MSKLDPCIEYRGHIIQRHIGAAWPLYVQICGPYGPKTLCGSGAGKLSERAESCIDQQCDG